MFLASRFLSKSVKCLPRAFVVRRWAFQDYNMRAYAGRIVRDKFRDRRLLQGEEAVQAIQEGTEQLKLVHRQVTVYNLFGPGRGASVMENL